MSQTNRVDQLPMTLLAFLESKNRRGKGNVFINLFSPDFPSICGSCSDFIFCEPKDYFYQEINCNGVGLFNEIEKKITMNTTKIR